MKDAPCYKCPDRQRACHDHCQQYIEWVKSVRELAQKQREDMRADGFLAERGLRMHIRPDSRIEVRRRQKDEF